LAFRSTRSVVRSAEGWFPKQKQRKRILISTRVRGGKTKPI
jgi:hypothetical protein